MDNKTKNENVQAEAPKKMPYNLRERKIKDAAYRTMIRAELAEELYQKIVEIVVLKYVPDLPVCDDRRGSSFF